MRKFGSPALFLVAGICFFLPFVTISCNQQVAAQFQQELGGEITDTGGDTFTGWELTTGSTGETEEAASEALGGTQPAGQISDSQPFAIAALTVAVLGLILSWMPVWLGPISGIVLAIGGIVSLFLAKAKVETVVKSAFDQAGAPPEFQILLAQAVDIKWQPAFWAAMALFGLAAGWSIFRLVSERRGAPSAAAPAPPGLMVPPPSTAPTQPQEPPPATPPTMPQGPPPEPPPPAPPAG